eukprot:7400306-Alexandrium_andersonii.AAC.1
MMQLLRSHSQSWIVHRGASSRVQTRLGVKQGDPVSGACFMADHAECTKTIQRRLLDLGVVEPMQWPEGADAWLSGRALRAGSASP